jgi:tRNA A-37 threonylcarbamoyl transferase component Bud32
MAIRGIALGQGTDERLRREKLNQVVPAPELADPLGEPGDDTRHSVEDGTLPGKLPNPPGLSRVDTLPEGFSSLLSRRPLFIGDVIAARYKLLESLGDGGMGQVFVAENLAIGRRVAVKVLKPELLADQHFRMRFQHEAQAIAAIEHRNVARFLDLVVGDPTFLVMEYVNGPTLAQVLGREKRLDVVRAVRIALRLCWGLEAVHRAGVVHRDLKPANVILAPDAELHEEPKIIDFGLAKLAYAPAEQQLTRSGQIIGTPHYMSPEQVENREVDPRSDVYALGCLLFHMLAGRTPFEGADDLAVLYQQVRNEPAPLSKFVPTAPPELEKILARALAKEPARRFPSTKEMAEALTALDKRRPGGGLGEGGSVTEQVRLPQVRLPWAAWLAAALLALPVGALVGWRAALPHEHGAVVVVNTKPLGAAVQLDGKLIGDTTPAVIRGVAPGDHKLRVLKQGAAPDEQVVHVQEGERTVVEFSLSSTARTVEITTIPAGALVYVDDRLQPAQTPLSVQVTEGDFHGLRVEKPGFVPVHHAMKPEDKEAQLSFELEVEKEPRGLLWVDSNQAAHVFVDGNDSNLVTPTVGMIVTVGSHTVELRDSANVMLATTKMQMAQGDSIHLTLDGCAPAKVEGGR